MYSTDIKLGDLEETDETTRIVISTAAKIDIVYVEVKEKK